MTHPAVDNVGAGHAALYSLERALNLGQHAAVNDALRNQLLDLVQWTIGLSWKVTTRTISRYKKQKRDFDKLRTIEV